MRALLLVAAAFLLMPVTADVASANGCHRSVERGPAGWHRHVGRNCARVAAASPFRGRDYDRRDFRNSRRDGPRCVQRCQYIGPIKQCKTVC